MTPIRSSLPNPGMPSPLAQTPGALTAQGIEARKAFFSAALNAAQAPTAVARPQPAEPEAVSRTASPGAPAAERPDTWGRPGRLVDIRV